MIVPPSSLYEMPLHAAGRSLSASLTSFRELGRGIL